MAISEIYAKPEALLLSLKWGVFQSFLAFCSLNAPLQLGTDPLSGNPTVKVLKLLILPALYSIASSWSAFCEKRKCP